MGKWSILVLVALGGCESTLDTGYKYTPLNASDAQRRGYYAAPFSPEATASKQNSSPIELGRPGAH